MAGVSSNQQAQEVRVFFTTPAALNWICLTFPFSKLNLSEIQITILRLSSSARQKQKRRKPQSYTTWEVLQNISHWNGHCTCCLNTAAIHIGVRYTAYTLTVWESPTWSLNTGQNSVRAAGGVLASLMRASGVSLVISSNDVPVQGLAKTNGVM